MIILSKEDAQYLEKNGAALKFTKLKQRPKLKPGEKADKVDSEVISVPHAKIIEKVTKRVWIDWTPGDTDEEAAKNAINAARKNTSLKPMTPIEAMSVVGKQAEALEAANSELAEAKKKLAELEAANSELAGAAAKKPGK